MEALKRSILVVYGEDQHPMTKDILEYLKSLDINIIVSRDPTKLNMAIHDKHTLWKQIVQKVVVIVSPEIWEYRMDQKPGDADMATNQAIAFELGFWLSAVGRDRLIAMFYDQKKFCIPCEFFDCNFIAWKRKQQEWRIQLKNFIENDPE